MRHLLIVPILLSVFTGCSGTQESMPSKASGFTQSGQASYYAMKFHNRKTASGETFNQYAHTAAHKKLPFGTKVRVTNTQNHKSVIVRINDRGPFVKGRIIDLSRSAFESIANLKSGVIRVKIEVIR
jgi:rare lipoprotein A